MLRSRHPMTRAAVPSKAVGGRRDGARLGARHIGEGEARPVVL
jgi:hypothetical protein